MIAVEIDVSDDGEMASESTGNSLLQFCWNFRTPRYLVSVVSLQRQIKGQVRIKANI